MPDQPWYAWEWLWEVGASWLHERWGLGGVTLVNLFLICLTFALLYRLVLRRCQNPIVSIGLTVLAASGSTIHWLARPHLITLLMTVIFMSILERVREGKTALLWWLPVLTVLWTNLHGGFFVGMILLGGYGIGFLLRALVAPEAGDPRSALRASAPYFVTAAGCLAASLVNPYSYQLHVHIAEYLRDPYAMNRISEFQGVDFHKPASLFLEMMLLLAVGAGAWLAARKQFGELLLLAVWAQGAMVAARNVPLFLIVAAPAAAVAMVAWGRSMRTAHVAEWLKRASGTVSEIGQEIAPLENMGRVHAVSLVVLAGITVTMNAPGAGANLQASYDPQVYPERALPILRFTDRIFTHDEWGDYLIYRLFPAGGKVFVDGRSDFYGAKFNEASYLGVMEVKHDWEKQLGRYGVDTMLLPVEAPLAGAVKESRNWRVVYDDGRAIVFRLARLAAQNAARSQGVSTGEASREGFGGNTPGPQAILREGRYIQSNGGQKL
jgi:hypothetical protein